MRQLKKNENVNRYHKQPKMKYYIYEIRVGLKRYIGHTKNMDDRWQKHKRSALNPDGRDGNILVYTEMRNYGVDQCEMHMLREIDVETKTQVRIEEQNEINQVASDICLNVNRAYATEEDNKQTDRERAKRQTIRKYSTVEGKEAEMARVRECARKRRLDPIRGPIEREKKRLSAAKRRKEILADPESAAKLRAYQAMKAREYRLKKSEMRKKSE